MHGSGSSENRPQTTFTFVECFGLFMDDTLRQPIAYPMILVQISGGGDEHAQRLLGDDFSFVIGLN